MNDSNPCIKGRAEEGIDEAVKKVQLKRRS